MIEIYNKNISFYKR